VTQWKSGGEKLVEKIYILFINRLYFYRKISYSAVVTGASSGIGRAIVEHLVQHEIVVIALARRVEKIDEYAKEINGRIYARKCDISNLNSVKETFEWIEEKFAHVHILINNAGILHKLSIFDTSMDAIEKMNGVIDTNFKGALNCAREAYRLIKNSNDYGMIININSIAGHNVYAGLNISNVYSPTKYALTALSEILRQELVQNCDDKVRVSNLSPGVVKTEIMVRGNAYKSQQDYDEIPHINPEDIAQGILYLLQTPYNVNVTQLTIKPVGERK
jgi:NADP-dependent 3-hydroxy acid dehydrogenase YdfG